MPVAHGAGDSGGFHDVLPPGTNGLANALQLIAFETTGARPPHNDDQLAMYRDLMYASPSVRAGQLGRYYKDSRFGAEAAGAGAPYHPGGRDVTVVRDTIAGRLRFGGVRTGMPQATFGFHPASRR